MIVAFGRLAAATAADVFNNQIEFVEYVCAGHACYLQSPSGLLRRCCCTTVEASGRAQRIQWRRSRTEWRGRRKYIGRRRVLGEEVVAAIANAGREKFVCSAMDG